MSEFTKGEWQVVEDKKLGCWLIVSRDKHNVTQKQVATAMAREGATPEGVFPSDKEGLANAHLIASAPDMYVALNCMIAGAAAVACPNAGERQVLQEAVDIAQKALKKAKGE